MLTLGVVTDLTGLAVVAGDKRNDRYVSVKQSRIGFAAKFYDFTAKLMTGYGGEVVGSGGQNPGNVAAADAAGGDLH